MPQSLRLRIKSVASARHCSSIVSPYLLKVYTIGTKYEIPRPRKHETAIPVRKLVCEGAIKYARQTNIMILARKKTSDLAEGFSESN
jgi:hypothetical protein